MQNTALGLAGGGMNSFVQGILEGQPEPPLYFGRMKRENRDGTPPAIPPAAPHLLEPETFADIARSAEAVVIDTRPDRYQYLARHWPGSIWAPGGGTNFLAIVGSYVEPHNSIVLISPA